MTTPTSPAEPGWLRRLLGYCRRHPVSLSIALGAALLGAVISAAVPLVIRHVVDKVLAPSTAHTGVGVWVGLLVVAAVLQYLITFARRYSAGQLSLDVQYDLRADVFASLVHLDGAKQDELDTGQVVSRSITDIGLVQGLLAFSPLLISNALLFVVSLIVMAVLSPLLTLIALAIAPLLWLVAAASRRDLFPANWDAQQQSAEVVGQVEAAVTGVRVVKGFGQEGRELDELEGRAKRLFASRMRVVRLQSVYTAALQSIPALGQVGVLMLGGWLALHGDITLGTFLAFATYLAALVGPVRQLAALLTIGQQARAGVVRVLDIVDAQPFIVSPDDPTAIPSGPVPVRMDDVVFAYQDSGPVLNGLSLTIDPGETVALVGGAGSGKSTAALLVPRFYDPQRGRVEVGGVDVRDADLADLRRRMGVVFEESFLFSDTIRANIAYGRSDATDAQIRTAAEMAQADRFIAALPNGYDTQIGERGLTLSGGQRQRLALARALLTDPSVLIMDDATSAVDPRVEADILQTLRAVTAERTTLLIAHRRSTLDLADRIAVLEHGRITDIGTFDELQDRNPLFRALFTVTDDAVADLASAAVAQPVATVTAELWQRPEEVAGPSAATQARAVSAAVASASGGGGGAMFGAVPATAELLERVAKLPAATDQPDLPDRLTRAPDPQFGLGRLLAPVKAVLTLGLLLVALDTVNQLVVPALIRTGINRGVTDRSESALFTVSFIALGVLAVGWVITFAGQRVTGRTSERLLYLLRVKTFAHLQRLGLDYYERELGGRIMTRMTTDIDALSNFLQTGVTTTLVSLLTIIGVLIALVLLDAGLSVVLLSMLPFLLVSTWLFRRKAVPAYEQARERISAVNAALQENVNGVRVTQAYGRVEQNTADYLRATDAYRVSRLRAQRYISIYFPFVQFLSDLSAAIVLAIGAARLREGTLSAGDLIAFFLYLELFFSPVQQLSQVFDSYQQSAVGLSRLRDLLRTPTSTPLPADPLPVPTLSGEIHLADVHFAYNGAVEEAVAGMDLVVPPGETIALVGETGAGKSSIVKLIARFYDPTGGAVLVDEHDLRRVDLEQYRQRLGIVPQEAYLSPGPLRDAIAYGRPGASDLEVENAARAVGAHEMIAGLSEGYLHEVGERGRNLSAGQRQLVALARAELVEPDILLLDEATASLDLASEAAVTAATAELTRQRTTVVVAHRLTTAARADRIVVLDQGRIVEIGRHDDLVAADGPYASLWAAYTAGSGTWVF